MGTQDSGGMTYSGTAGVDYGAMDPYKRACQTAGLETARYLERFGFKEVEWSRGESCFLVETPFGYLAFVVEGLGTKNLVADGLVNEIAQMVEVAEALGHLLGKSFYDGIGQCNFAMAANDLATLGASCMVYGQYLAIGNGGWFDNEKRQQDLVRGTKNACHLARCTWGCGETPTLRDIIDAQRCDLAGAIVGLVAPKSRLINPANIQAGDAIVVLEADSINANGLTMARDIAAILPSGYLTRLSDGRTYGETLLEPTPIYATVVEECLDQGINIHYVVNVTGHGLRKAMRAVQPFAYVIDTLPPNQKPIFTFMQEHGPVSDFEAYQTLNMGYGYLLYVAKADVEAVIQAAAMHNIAAFCGGHIEEGEKCVKITPKDIVYDRHTLNLR